MRTFIKKLISTFVIAFFIISLFGQRASAQLFTGGDFNVTFINGINIDLAPIVGYKYKKLNVGIAPVVNYSAYSTIGIGGEFAYGGRIFLEYEFWKGIMVHAEFEALNAPYVITNLDGTSFKKRHWIMGIPIGIGYQREIGNGVWFNVMVLYDALLDIDTDQLSPKANPQVRGGITYVFK